MALADVEKTPRTPKLLERYGCFQESPVCTRKEMCQKHPNMCRVLNKSETTCLLRNTAPSKISKARHAPLMESPDAHPVSFVQNLPGRRISMYVPNYGTGYLDRSFKMVNILGCGSFGVVMRMLCKKDRMECAVKYSMKYKNQRDRYEKWREVAFLEFIDHPNCLEFRTAWEEADTLYIQTELCICNLQKYIFKRDGKVPERKIWNVLLDVLRALAYLHRNSILHLDVKPENILLSKDGIAKLGDFGMAFYLGSDNPEECCIEGDSRYLAQEALADESEFRVSTKRDIYSLGLCILQLATDLWIPSDGEQLAHIRKLELPDKLTSRVPPELSSLVFKMMAENPKDRPEADQILSMENVKPREQERLKFVEQHAKKRREEEFGTDWIKSALEQARTKTILKSPPRRISLHAPRRIIF